MYNPINMHIEDRDRLYQKDLREKNKRARYEVRYDVEADIRKDGMVQFERDQEMRHNKISMMRYKEELERGFHILTNNPISNDDGDENDTAKTTVYDHYTKMQEAKRQPRVWSKAMNTVNRAFLSENEKLAIEVDEEERKKTQNGFNKTNCCEQMRITGGTDINGLVIDRRSRRVQREHT